MPDAPAELHGLRVLVVEDEFLVAMDLEASLRALGCEVLGPHGDLNAALGAARDAALDAALLDVNIGGTPVTPVADALARRDVPFVFCTGYEADSLPERYAGTLRLMKPFQSADVRSVLQRCLAGRGSARRS